MTFGNTLSLDLLLLLDLGYSTEQQKHFSKFALVNK